MFFFELIVERKHKWLLSFALACLFLVASFYTMPTVWETFLSGSPLTQLSDIILNLVIFTIVFYPLVWVAAYLYESAAKR